MDSLLKHMVDLTGHRDHTMLDISVISAVQELSGAAQTRMLGISLTRDCLFVRPRASAKIGERAKIEAPNESEETAEPISNYPALEECINQHKTIAEQITADGVTIWLPIWLNDKVNVCLEVTNPTPYNGQTVQVIEGVVSVYRNFQNLLDYSERDSLTGLLNRKTFDDQLSRMLAASAGANESAAGDGGERRVSSEGEEQWLVVVDIDHFKRVNDVFGHIYGDEVLILVANLMTSSFRAQDRVFRFGGEEFVVLLRDTTLENATKIVERFRTNVEENEFPQVGRITISAGFAHIRAYDSPVVILGHADQALYYAKTHGRNMACHYDALVRDGLLQAEKTSDDVEFF